MAKIHSTARVSRHAELGEDVVVGPAAIVEGGAQIAEGARVGAFSIIWASTVVGENTRVYPHCSLGGEPQDKKYAGEPSRLVVGANNTIREFCFFNRGTEGGGGETRIGDDNWLMAYVHIAHDCVVGSRTTIANAVQVAGHAIVGDDAVLGGGTLVHQFSRVGRGAMVGGGERVRADIPPFALCGEGKMGVNAEGMRRGGFSAEDIALVKSAHRDLYRANLPLNAARAKIADSAAKATGKGKEALEALLEFLAIEGRGIARPRGI